MKKLIGHDTQNGSVLGSYGFSPSTNQITIIGMPNLALEQILLITDISSTTTSIIYNFANPTMTGSILNNVITLDFNCSGLNTADALQIYVDIPDTAPTDTAAMQDAYTHLLLQRICDLLEPMATQDAAQRQRVTVDAIVPNVVIGSGTVTTVSTITNAVPVGNIATLGGGNPEWTFMDIARQSYDTLRSKLTFGN